MPADPQIPVRQVSFVLPCWNEEAILGRTLDGLFAAARPLALPFEVIVADDASSDRTPDIARQRGALVCEECSLSWALKRQGRFVLLRETVLS